jgi:hypothetical protein
MTTQTKSGSLEDLELKLVLENQIEVPEGNKTFIYKASLEKFTADTIGVYADTVLTKYEKITKFRKKVRFLQGEKLISIKDEHYDILEEVWKVNQDQWDDRKIIHYNCAYLKTLDNKTDFDFYKKSLIKIMANKGMKNYPSYELISRVFKPIDDSINQFWEQINKK